MTNKDKSLEFLKKQIEQQTNHVVRNDEEIKGIVDITAKNDGTFNIRLHRGTENEAVEIEDIDKERLISMMEEQL